MTRTVSYRSKAQVMEDLQPSEPGPGGRHSAFSGEFLAHLHRGELRYARCAKCGSALAYAERACRAHPQAPLAWLPASGRGILHAIAIYRLSYAAERPAPYNVAVVELDEGPRLVSTVRCSAGARPAIGMALRAAFSAEGLLVFDPA